MYAGKFVRLDEPAFETVTFMHLSKEESGQAADAFLETKTSTVNKTTTTKNFPNLSMFYNCTGPNKNGI